MTNIEEQVIEIIAKQLNKSNNDITMESKFADDLGADSLDLVEMIMEFEEIFDIEVQDDVAEELTSVQKVVDYVKKVT